MKHGLDNFLRIYVVTDSTWSVTEATCLEIVQELLFLVNFIEIQVKNKCNINIPCDNLLVSMKNINNDQECEIFIWNDAIRNLSYFQPIKVFYYKPFKTHCYAESKFLLNHEPNQKQWSSYFFLFRKYH